MRAKRRDCSKSYHVLLELVAGEAASRLTAVLHDGTNGELKSLIRRDEKEKKVTLNHSR
jgi:hypothetical protein